MSAKCCFQIWIRSSIPRQMVVYNKTHPDFDFIPYGEKDKNNQPTPHKELTLQLEHMVENGTNCTPRFTKS